MAWTLPATGGISSPYGPRILAGAIGNFHYGVDLRAKRGPVRAAQDGIVRTIWQTAKGAWVVDLRHADEAGHQIRTRYVHMYRNEIRVSVGQKVKAGDQIGTSGASGTTAAHLHYEVLVDGVLVDPVPFMRARGVDLDAQTVTNPGPTTGPVPTAPDGTLPAPLTPTDLWEDDMIERALIAAYRLGMERTPGAGELDPRIVRIARGESTLKGEVDQILTSFEAGVFRLYRTLLQRAPEAGRVAYWQTQTGGDLAKVEASIKASDEYKALQAKA